MDHWGNEDGSNPPVHIILPTSDCIDVREHIAFHSSQCIECYEHSEIGESEDKMYEWQTGHYKEADHPSYWHYRIERVRARMIIHQAKGHW
jgi:hypothetical protein